MVAGGGGVVADVVPLAVVGAGVGESLLVGDTLPKRRWAKVTGETGIPNSLGE